MKRHAIVPALLLATVLCAAACFNITRQHKEVYYYQIEYQAPAVGGTPFKDVVVRLASFTVAPSYQSQNILYSTGPNKRKAYDYHLWVVNPGDMLTEAFHRDMAESNLYKAVVDSRSSVVPQYEVEGIIEQIFEKDDGKNWYSVLSMRCVFFAYSGGKYVLFQRVYEEGVKTDGKYPVDVVGAMSKAASKISTRLQKDINEHVAAYEASKAKEAEQTKSAQ
jgi:ABC-type uncharacterized transport system auxiliary subunit